ncbi:4-hydroxy-tetrahydrodipicolinate synthase [Cloacibacillus sp. An23]|uniref:4-hydroxy-tetrahydrodipicolinate synthase n=1 Tax=Cloacibacillus sp. An23 TaxID=1965591 RepID=UPI000B3ADCAA|nr:4-hydroxy-tetrahydrodipicolinate synthase [Cloacibacillus sp. An23]OUO93241.1 4-hydroxy-tetrahydrodipicolinate synthase [Cloacibacillus sp. An23]
MKFMFNGKPFSGVISAVVTPFDGNNTVDEAKMKSLVDWQIESGISGILVLGGSGEYVSLTMNERVRAVRAAAGAAAGRVPVVAGVLEPGIGDSVEAANLFREAGADVPLVLTPYYVTPSQDGIYDFFKKFDEGFNSPFLVYNIPYKNHTDIKPSTFARLAGDVPNCCGIKECSPAFASCVELVHSVGNVCTVMSGEDLMMCGHVLFGAEAAVIASANLIPAAWVKAFEDAKAKNVEAVAAFQKKYYPLFNLLFAETNPAPMKYAMRKIGVDAGEVSTPLKPCSAGLRSELDKIIGALGVRK